MNIGVKKSIVTGGKEISIETGKLAKQADGAVVLQMGNTVLLATVVSANLFEVTAPSTMLFDRTASSDNSLVVMLFARRTPPNKLLFAIPSLALPRYVSVVIERVVFPR
jgi:hypothetical protein